MDVPEQECPGEHSQPFTLHVHSPSQWHAVRMRNSIIAAGEAAPQEAAGGATPEGVCQQEGAEQRGEHAQEGQAGQRARRPGQGERARPERACKRACERARAQPTREL